MSRIKKTQVQTLSANNSMSYRSQIDAFSLRIKEENELLAKHATLSELCDMVDAINSSQDYEYYLNTLFPQFLSQLETIPISFDGNSYEHKCRNTILDILNRSAMNDTFESYGVSLCEIVTQLIKVENEENGIVCFKIATSLFKSYKAMSSEKIESFVGVVMEIYNNVPELVNETFNKDGVSTSPGGSIYHSPANAMSPGAGDESKQLPKAIFSFKVLAECPIAMVTLCSSYKMLSVSVLPQFVPLIISLLSTEAQEQARARAEKEARNERLISVSSNIKNRASFCDFFNTQAKAASFLAYVYIRGLVPQVMKEYIALVPDLMMRLLQDCPSEMTQQRKELLHATRHILSTQYRSLFISKLDLLFDESVLIGDGLTCRETLKPLAYSMVADFLHNVRGELQITDLLKTIKMYTKFLQDTSLALTVQIMSAKLLLNIVERILQLSAADDESRMKGRQMLMLIVEGYAVRFQLLTSQYENIMKHHQDFEDKKREKQEEFQKKLDMINNESMEFVVAHIPTLKADKTDEDGDIKMGDDSLEGKKEVKYIDRFDLPSRAPINLSPAAGSDPLKDAFYLYRTLMSFLKTILSDLKMCNPPKPKHSQMTDATWNSLARVFSYEEVRILSNLYRHCILGLKFFSTTNKRPDDDGKTFDITSPQLTVSSSKDSRELMEFIVLMLMQLDTPTYSEILESQLPFTYQCMLEDYGVLHLAQSLLTSEVTTQSTSSVLLKFLLTKLESLGNVGYQESNVLIRLFKLCFMSINLYPNMNEDSLLPHLNDLILKSLEHSSTAKEPLVYFYLIRTCFRSIGGGRFEKLYKTLWPLLQVTLQTLNRLMLTARRPAERDIYVELCLTVPVRLSVLVPHLNYLMRPLVFALNGTQEQIVQGLRTLELCVDNLTAEFFDPIVEPVMEEVMQGLYNLLKPLPQNHQVSHGAVRILGKLGGRNRRYIKPFKDLKTISELNTSIDGLFSIEGLGDNVPVSVTPGIESALEVLEDHQSSMENKEVAFTYLTTVLKLILESNPLPEDFAQRIDAAVALLEGTDEKSGLTAIPAEEQNHAMDNQTKLVGRLLEAVFYATSIENAEVEATKLIGNLVNHFSLLHVSTVTQNKRKSLEDTTRSLTPTLNDYIFLEAIQYALGSYLSKVKDAGVNAIKSLHQVGQTIYGPEKTLLFSIVPQILQRSVHACYEEAYYCKAGGVLGIKTIIQDLEAPISFLKTCQYDVIRALFFVLKDIPADAPAEIIETAKEMALQLLQTVANDISDDEFAAKLFQNTIDDIVCDLNSPTKVVRDTCQRALQIVSEVKATSQVELMDSAKFLLLNPIFAKPLRALPLPMQIGNVSAIIYCLSLPNSFLVFNEELSRLLQEALALVDADDASLTNGVKVFEHKTSEYLVSLRCVCIDLLSLALTNQDFANAQQGNIRIRILGVFFKLILSDNTTIIDATYEGLKRVLDTNAKLPKELLQNGLRPMLLNLADHKKLNVYGLKSLARLLGLLISYFKVEIGRKLLDHLNAWAQLDTLDSLAGKDLENNDTVQIISGILNIFHLLPDLAYTFMDEIMQKLHYLETSLRLRFKSPFRAPVGKFLNRFHEHSAQFFLERFIARPYVLRLCYFIEQEEYSQLRDSVADKIQGFFDSYANEEKIEHKTTKFANLIDLFTSLAKTKGPEWVSLNKPLLEKVTNSIGGMAAVHPKFILSSIYLQIKEAVEAFQDLWILYMENNMGDHLTLLTVLDCLCTWNITLSSKFTDFMYLKVVSSDDYERRQNLIQTCLEYATKHNNATATFLLKHVVNSIYVYEGYTTGSLDKVISPKCLSIVHDIWKSVDSEINDIMRLELLQLTAVWIKWAPNVISDIRKDVIKFSWNFFKLEDALAKQAAYMVTSYFISTYETPVKIVTQIFVALLRNHQLESRYMVRESLDLLTPVLPVRMGGDNDWIKWVRRILSENNIIQNVTVYQLLIHHPDLFYSSRDHFIPNMINFMGRLTMMNQSGAENQVIAIDLASLILNWEKQNKQEDEKENDYVMPSTQRDACVAFLIRYICSSGTRAQDSELGQRALSILSEVLDEDFWPEVTIKLAFFEKFLVQTDLTSTGAPMYCLNALDVLAVALEKKPASWVILNLGTLQTFLEKSLRSDNHDVQEGLQRVLGTVLAAISEEGNEESTSFIQLVVGIIADDLQGTTSVAAGVTLCWTLFQHNPAAIDPLLPAIMKTFTRLCKDHISIASQDTAAAEEAKLTTKLLEKILYICAIKISVLGDQRRAFLGLVASLIDRSMEQSFLKKIIAIIRNWIFQSNEIFPTVKEKTALLNRMLAFEVRCEPTLSAEFYKIILDIFHDPAMMNSELTVRMEQPFLVGTKIQNKPVRKELMSILDQSLDRNIRDRLIYVIRDQNWEFIADYLWLDQSLQLMYGSFHNNKLSLVERFQQPSLGLQPVAGDARGELQDLLQAHKQFVEECSNITAMDVLTPLIEIFFLKPAAVKQAWMSLFPIALKSISKSDTMPLIRSLITLLSKEYHMRQATMEYNVINILLESIAETNLELPPHLVKYLGATYNAWYSSLNILENTNVENDKILGATEDALLELYVNLQEDDMFYGLWRRRAKYSETSIALSYEQIGLWDKAQQLYEAAQIKARSGALPYGESEYSLWEDNWIMCAEKLQQWDILTDLAKHEGFTDLLLECGWRVADWDYDRDPLEQGVKAVMDVPTPRRHIFETFLKLQDFANRKTADQDVKRMCEEGQQLALRKWVTLPKRVTAAHIPLLHTFQQYVEFMEACQIYISLHMTTSDNLEKQSQELKRVLQAWRERLPNIHDDINIWNDLITWRQHAFTNINSVYMPFVPVLQQNTEDATVSHAYRGYHEIAWVINRFAHVARKHHMPEVCIKELARIYSLPNIEIQEAFLKLREQAKCHYANMNELTTGLDVISNTNLAYFVTQQKAEFFTLKGMFLSKLNAQDEANQAFATAVQIDLNLAKAWAQWGFFNDSRLKEDPNNMSYANNAISCYLQAAGLYKNSKTRKLLCRILWLISLDDETGSLAAAFDSFRGDVPVWYWITFIPQLLTSLSHKEAAMVRTILIRIAKGYPQALHFQLRTTKEDFTIIQRQSQLNNSASTTRQPWDHLEELNGILKTAYPLLALSLESLVDQISQRFKVSIDDELFRLINVLLMDATHNFNKLPYPRDSPKLPSTTETNLVRFAEQLSPLPVKQLFMKDFIQDKPNFQEYIMKLRKWRQRLQEKLDSKLSIENLEKLCPHLSTFHLQKFEEIEVPGQYLLNKDSNAYFVKINRFMPRVDYVRTAVTMHRRITMRGHNGSKHVFTIQYPATRHSRREERIFQLYRLFNETLDKNVQTRRRNITFTLPVAVPLSPQIRIINDSDTSISLMEIYDKWCKSRGMDRDAIQDFTTQQMNAAYDPILPKPDATTVRIEIFNAVQAQFLPDNVVTDYFASLFTDYEEFWLFKKQFTSQYASFSFMSFMLSINSRTPLKIHIDYKSGQVSTSEMLPNKLAAERVKMMNPGFEWKLPMDAPVLYNNEPVQFRLTPNIQKLIGESGLEGIFCINVFNIARALLEPENELDTFLSLFIRDEVISWYSIMHRSIVEDPKMRDIVRANVDMVIRKVATIGHLSSSPAMATQHVQDLISASVNPKNLANMDQLFIAAL